MGKEFWRDWKRITKREEKAIRTVRLTKKAIFKEIPKEIIISLYVKGSFIRREMNKKSDVDFVMIVKNNGDLKKVKKFSEKYEDMFETKINVSPHSLWELKNNKLWVKSKKPRARPDLLIKKVKEYKLLYGKEINPEDYPKRDNINDLKIRIETFRKVFIPYYEQKKFGFQEIIKQVFWLVELEEKVSGNNPPETWKKLARSIKDKKHIIHDTLRFRLKPTKDKVERKAFIGKLNRYLLKLEKII